MTDLILRSVFPEPPSDALRLAFGKHIATTGRPETFSDISTAQPPKDGTVVVLEHPVDINRKTRSDRGMAPCPICSPEHGKYLNGGSLIWCEATQAIYAIGPRCSAHLWEDGRMNKAINLFMESERAKADGIRLYHLVLRIPRLLEWIVRNRSLASDVTNAHTSFAKDMRRLRGAMSRALKASNGTALDRGPLTDIPIGTVIGRPFLSGGWALGSDLDQVATVLRAFPVIEGQDLLHWIDALTPSVRAAKCKEIERARETLARAEQRMEAASSFLSARNTEVLGRWGKGEGAPMSFSVSMTTSRITFREGDAMWQGPALLPPPRGTVEPTQGWSLNAA